MQPSIIIIMEKLEKTGEDKKTSYIGGEYPRQLNVIDFWGIFNWRRSRVNWRRIVYSFHGF